MPDPTPARKRNQAKPLPSLEILDDLLIYDPETGIIRWRKASGSGGRVPAGAVAGHLNTKGYRIIYVIGRPYKAHRLAFKMYHRREPAGEIDHRDTNKDNNRADNLREAVGSGNQCNKTLDIRNTSGVKGVSWRRDCGKWGVHLRVNGKQFHLGFFYALDDATAAIRAARERIHGEFANHG